MCVLAIPVCGDNICELSECSTCAIDCIILPTQAFYSHQQETLTFINLCMRTGHIAYHLYNFSCAVGSMVMPAIELSVVNSYVNASDSNVLSLTGSLAISCSMPLGLAAGSYCAQISADGGESFIAACSIQYNQFVTVLDGTHTFQPSFQLLSPFSLPIDSGNQRVIFNPLISNALLSISWNQPALLQLQPSDIASYSSVLSYPFINVYYQHVRVDLILLSSWRHHKHATTQYTLATIVQGVTNVNRVTVNLPNNIESLISDSILYPNSRLGLLVTLYFPNITDSTFIPAQISALATFDTTLHAPIDDHSTYQLFSPQPCTQQYCGSCPLNNNINLTITSSACISNIPYESDEDLTCMKIICSEWRSQLSPSQLPISLTSQTSSVSTTGSNPSLFKHTPAHRMYTMSADDVFGIDMGALVSDLSTFENAAKVGYDPNTNSWVPHASVEGGTPTIGYGHKCTVDDMEDGGICSGDPVPDQTIKSIMTADIDRSIGIVSSYLDDNFDDSNCLTASAKTIVVEMVYQMGKNGLFPNAITDMATNRWQAAEDEMLDSSWASQTPARAETLASRIGSTTGTSTCHPPPPELPPDNPPDGGSTGIAAGDPHYTSFDGQHFDFQGYGDFLLSRCQSPSASSPVTIQVRLQPMPGTILPAVTLTQGVAVQFGEYSPIFNLFTPLNQFGIIVSINGVVVNMVNGSSGEDYPYNFIGGVIRQRSPLSVDLLSEDGYRVSVLGGYFGRFSNVLVSVPSSVCNHCEGLLGNNNGQIEDEFTNPNGQILSTAWAFGNSWNVSIEDSLFDDALTVVELDPLNAQLAALYYPAALPQPDPAIQQLAQSACANLISPFYDDCVLDVIATNNTQWAVTSAASHQLSYEISSISCNNFVVFNQTNENNHTVLDFSWSFTPNPNYPAVQFILEYQSLLTSAWNELASVAIIQRIVSIDINAIGFTNAQIDGVTIAFRINPQFANLSDTTAITYAYTSYFFPYATCIPNCVNRVCGADNCGGRCGQCNNGQICNEAFNCQSVEYNIVTTNNDNNNNNNNNNNNHHGPSYTLANNSYYVVDYTAKSSCHPYYGVGDYNGYSINGIEGATITVLCGESLSFDLSNVSSGLRDAFYISTSVIGAGRMPVVDARYDATHAVYSWTAPKITVSTTPTLFYYHSMLTDHAGGIIQVLSCSHPYLQYTQIYPQSYLSLNPLIPLRSLLPRTILGPYVISSTVAADIASLGLNFNTQTGCMKLADSAILHLANVHVNNRRRLLSDSSHAISIYSPILNSNSTLYVQPCSGNSYGYDCACDFTNITNSDSLSSFQPQLDSLTSIFYIANNVPLLQLVFALPAYYFNVYISLPQCNNLQFPVQSYSDLTAIQPCTQYWLAIIEYDQECTFFADSTSIPDYITWYGYVTVHADMVINDTTIFNMPYARSLQQSVKFQVMFPTNLMLSTTTEVVNVTFSQLYNCNSSFDCSTHGACVQSQCQCENGWAGTHCESNIDECSAQYQTDHGAACFGTNVICTDLPGSYSCSCPVGFSGNGSVNAPCVDIDECAYAGTPGYCAASNQCTNTIGSFYCHCPAVTGYSGNGTFESPCIPINPCLANNGGCRVHVGVPTNVSTCIYSSPGTAVCSCAGVGYSLDNDGVTCNDIDMCGHYSSLCEGPGALCHNQINNYTCNCTTGYAGAGTTVSPCTPPPSCSPFPCYDYLGHTGAVAICSIFDNNPVCSCPDGFAGNGTIIGPCVDIDECASTSTNNCDAPNHCQNSIGRFNCYCPSNLLGSGTVTDPCACPINMTFDNTLQTCAFDNVCTAEFNTINCPSHSTCEPTLPGSYNCVCNDRYERNNTTASCALIDYCNLLQACDAVHGSCINTPASASLFQCSCTTGYELLSNNTCQLIDLCQGTVCFGSNPICINADPIVGQYSCTCPPSSQGNGSISSPCVGSTPAVQAAIDAVSLVFNDSVSTFSHIVFDGQIELLTKITYPYMLELRGIKISGDGTNSNTIEFTSDFPSCNSSYPSDNQCIQQLAIGLNLTNVCAVHSTYTVYAEIVCSSSVIGCSLPNVTSTTIQFHVDTADLCQSVTIGGQPLQFDQVKFMILNSSYMSNTSGLFDHPIGSSSLSSTAQVPLFVSIRSSKVILDGVQFKSVQSVSDNNPAGTYIIDTNGVANPHINQSMLNQSRVIDGISEVYSILLFQQSEQIPVNQTIAVTYTANIGVQYDVVHPTQMLPPAICRMHIQSRASNPSIPSSSHHRVRLFSIVPVTYQVQANVYYAPDSSGLHNGNGNGNGDGSGASVVNSGSGSGLSVASVIAIWISIFCFFCISFIIYYYLTRRNKDRKADGSDPCAVADLDLTLVDSPSAAFTDAADIQPQQQHKDHQKHIDIDQPAFISPHQYVSAQLNQRTAPADHNNCRQFDNISTVPASQQAQATSTNNQSYSPQHQLASNPVHANNLHSPSSAVNGNNLPSPLQANSPISQLMRPSLPNYLKITARPKVIRTYDEPDDE